MAFQVNYFCYTNFNMFFFLVVILVASCKVYGQAINNVRVVDHRSYLRELIQETMHEVENRGWCNLKLQDQVQDYDESIFDWKINGEVTYTDGFVISVGNMDLLQSSLNQIWGIDSTDNSTTVRIEGTLRLHEVALGFDVEARMTDGDQYFTGVYTHERIEFRMSLTKNMHSTLMTTAGSVTSLSAGNVRRMMYMPETKLTEFLSRHYVPSSAWNGVGDWVTESFVPIMQKLATTKVQFPGLCYNCNW